MDGAKLGLKNPRVPKADRVVNLKASLNQNNKDN